jgi:tetratricopeptide (TPR) repeat protein
MQGDSAAQLASYDRCLEARPGSAECLSKRVVLRGRRGQCEAMRDDARELTSRAPSLAQGFELLANALLATGERGPAVEETLAQRWALLPEDKRRAAELQDRAAIAVLDGDFDRAAELHDAWIASVSDKRDPFSRGLPVLREARLFEEIDRPKQASELATEFLARMKALPDAIGGDMSIHFLGVAARTGALTQPELAERRSAWLDRYRAKWVAAGRKTDLEFEWIAWSTAYGGEVRDAAQAEEAKRAMPREHTRVVDTGRWTAMDLNVGRVLVLTGDPAGAIEPLRRAATSCQVLDEPMRAFVAQLYLGLALAQTGDHAGAKKAFESVVSAWGKKKSRSKTAKAAALALKTLEE